MLPAATFSPSKANSINSYFVNGLSSNSFNANGAATALAALDPSPLPEIIFLRISISTPILMDKLEIIFVSATVAVFFLISNGIPLLSPMIFKILIPGLSVTLTIISSTGVLIAKPIISKPGPTFETVAGTTTFMLFELMRLVPNNLKSVKCPKEFLPQ